MVKIENWATLVIFGSHCRGMNVLPSIAPFKWKPGGEGVSLQKHVLGKCWLASRWDCYLARISNTGTDREKMKSSWTVLWGRIVGLRLEWRCEWTTLTISGQTINQSTLFIALNRYYLHISDMILSYYRISRHLIIYKTLLIAFAPINVWQQLSRPV